MTRLLEIALTLILFAAGMAVVGWVVNATVPSGVDWLDGAIGKSGSWALLIGFWIICGILAWHGHRKAGRAAGR